MKLVCTSLKCNGVYPNTYSHLTLNKIYKVIGMDKDLLNIIDDSGYNRWYYAKNFSTLSSVRQEKLEKLGIN